MEDEFPQQYDDDCSDAEPENVQDEDYGTQKPKPTSNKKGKGRHKRRRKRGPRAHASEPLSLEARIPVVGESYGGQESRLLTIIADFNPRVPKNGDDAVRKQQRKMVEEHGIQLGRNNLANLPGVEPGDAHHTDSLHVLVLGLFSKTHLMRWIQEFLTDVERILPFHDAWLALPRYLNFRKPIQRFCDVDQWSGHEMKSFIRIIVPCLEAALWNAAPEHREACDNAIRCVAAIVDFYLMTQYRSHTGETLDWLDRYLQRFHMFKDVFRVY